MTTKEMTDPRAQLGELPDACCREIVAALLDQSPVNPTLIGLIQAMAMRRRAEQMTVEEFDRAERRRPTKEERC